MESGIYRHYKGDLYLVLGLAQHSETDEICVVYVSMNPDLPGPRMRVRPLDGPAGFRATVGPGDPGELRFTYVGDTPDGQIFSL